MKKRKSLLSFALAAIAAVSIFAGVKLGTPHANASDKTSSEFFSATKNAQIITGYQLSEEFGSYKGLFVKAPDNGESTITLNHELDLRAFTKSDALISVLPVPTAPIEKASYLPIQSIIVRLTDVEDTDIFVEMKVQRNADDAYPYAGYAQGRGSGQVMTGINFDKGEPRYYSNGNYGRKVDANFYGRGRTGMEITSEIKPYKFAYDYETSSVHSLSARDGNNSTLVADLLDSTTMSGIFKGFKSGKVILSVTATSDGFNNKDAGFLITDFAGLNLSQNAWEDDDAPLLAIDTKGYAESDLPRAELYRPYPVFTAVAFDKFDAAYGLSSAEKVVDVVVRKAGGAPLQTQNGYFYPTETGIYEIAYTAVDQAGNRAEKVLQIHTENPQNISFAWDNELVPSCIVGEKVVVPTGGASGVYGEYDTSITVLFDGEEIAIENGGFMPERAGVYQVQVVVKDFLDRTATFLYYVEATAKIEPVLVSTPSIPVAFYQGKSISLPDFEAYDYYSLAGQKLEAEKYFLIEDSKGNVLKKVAPNEVFVVGETFGESVNVTFVAKSFLYNAEVKDTFQVKVIDNSQMDFENCFVYENSVIAKDQETGKNVNISGELGLAFLFEDDTAKIKMAGEMLFYGLELSFRVPQEANNYDAIVVTVTDAKFANRQVVFKIEKTQVENNLTIDPIENLFNYSNFYVNGELVGKIWGHFVDMLNDDFQLRINARAEIIDSRGNVVCKIDKYLTGEPFEGFSDNLCYISFGFEGVSGSSALQITNVNDQIVDPTDTYDYTGPAIQLTSSFNSEQNTGDIVLPGAVAVDLIEGRTDVYVEIILASTYQTVYTGKVGLEEFRVSLKKSGSYSVVYYAEDRSNLSILDRVLHVYDAEPYSVVLQGQVPTTAKYGDKISLPNYVVDSRLSSYDVVVYVLCPRGGMMDVTDSLSFTATQTGIYKVYYYVVYEMENSYSYDMQEFEIVVE